MVFVHKHIHFLPLSQDNIYNWGGVTISKVLITCTCDISNVYTGIIYYMWLFIPVLYYMYYIPVLYYMYYIPVLYYMYYIPVLYYM